MPPVLLSNDIEAEAVQGKDRPEFLRNAGEVVDTEIDFEATEVEKAERQLSAEAWLHDALEEARLRREKSEDSAETEAVEGDTDNRTVKPCEVSPASGVSHVVALPAIPVAAQIMETCKRELFKEPIDFTNVTQSEPTLTTFQATATDSRQNAAELPEEHEAFAAIMAVKSQPEEEPAAKADSQKESKGVEPVLAADSSFPPMKLYHISGLLEACSDDEESSAGQSLQGSPPATPAPVFSTPEKRAPEKRSSTSRSRNRTREQRANELLLW